MSDVPGDLDAARKRLKEQAYAAGRPFLTPKMVANRLELSERTVRQMIADGDIDSYRFGGARRIDADDLDRYIAEHRQRTSKR